MLNDDTEDASDNTESVRIEAAAALRELAHTFISHELDEATVVALCDWAAPRDRCTEPHVPSEPTDVDAALTGLHRHRSVAAR